MFDYAGVIELQKWNEKDSTKMLQNNNFKCTKVSVFV